MSYRYQPNEKQQILRHLVTIAEATESFPILAGIQNMQAKPLYHDDDGMNPALMRLENHDNSPKNGPICLLFTIEVCSFSPGT